MWANAFLEIHEQLLEVGLQWLLRECTSFWAVMWYVCWSSHSFENLRYLWCRSETPPLLSMLVFFACSRSEKLQLNCAGTLKIKCLSVVVKVCGEIAQVKAVLSLPQQQPVSVSDVISSVALDLCQPLHKERHVFEHQGDWQKAGGNVAWSVESPLVTIISVMLSCNIGFS